MEKTNNESGEKKRPSKFWISMLAGFLVTGGIFYFTQRTSSPKQSEGQSSVPAPAQSQSESVPAQSADDLTGKWAGKYKVSSPKGCAGFSGSWTADVTQNGKSFSGSYKSDVVVNGVISGSSSSSKDFNWIVTGGGGARLKGKVVSLNKVEGNFTGPVCPGTSQKTTGTFSGGR